ncbi:tetratricopeptide repeat protein 21B-like [Bacillus rossius redtenbacheri]|uniref:tetratricopeptide repeat protein 21B-like n=1 Tax=Bacillus rossius redtenbacheri TaxID=93214 RepID=UPI002FDD6AD4
MDERDLKALASYHCRAKHYHAMQTVALEGAHRFPDDAVFRLLSGVALVLNHRGQEAVRELAALRPEQGVSLAAALALTAAHRRAPAVDREALAALDTRVKEERKHAGEAALSCAALVLHLLGRADKAREYVDRALKADHDFPDGLCIKGWIELASGKDGLKYFESALENSVNKKNMDAVFGKASCLTAAKKFEAAVAVLNQLVVRYSSFSPPLVEKMKNQLGMLDIEQALETANRILSGDPHCLEAMKLKVLIVICRDGNYEEGALALRRFCGEMENVEPRNSDLFIETARLFSRVCGRNPAVLTETYRLAEKAAQLDPNSPELMTELGYQCLLQGRLKEASKFYRNASKIDDSSVVSLSGLTMCQLIEGNTEQARQQVEFLREVQGSSPSPELLLMSAQLDPASAVKYLNDAVDIHFSKSFGGLSFGCEYLLQLNPDFLLQVVKEYLLYVPVQMDVLSVQDVPESLEKTKFILETVTKACPGLLEALHQLAKVQFLSGDIKSAAATLQHILDDVDATFSDAHLLMAQIHSRQDNFQGAAQSLEVGLSYNFKIRDHPLYHLITAQIHRHEGKLDECLRSLKTAMSLSKRSEPGLALADKATMYLELVEAYKACDRSSEATAVMQDAIEEFQGTSEEGRITIANGNLALHRGDVALSLELLGSVTPSQPHYQQARCRMADIHLNHRRDRRAYVETFRELMDTAPGPRSLAMLGDAYMSVQEPERAIDAYEKALKQSTRDVNLARKIGRALVQTHQYGKAISYYREAVKGDGSNELRLDMAELYMRLRQYDKAEHALKQELDASTKSIELSALITRTKVLLMLAEVREKAGNIKASLETLKEASDNQGRVLKRSGAGEDQKKVATHICQQMAERAAALRDHDLAIRYYKEALSFMPENPDTLVALARLFMQVNDLENCQATCMTLLKADANNEAATVMLADLAFRKVDFETAKVHFQQLLSRQPNYWTALARMVEVLRRTGKLEEVPEYLEKASAACARPAQEAGLSYCRGLNHWYCGNLNQALREFNGARRDAEWGQQAVYNMIEICLNPDDDVLGDSAASEDDEEFHGSREMALRTAERLLSELKPGGGRDEMLNHRLLSNFLLLAARQKSTIERALQDLTSMASQDAYRDHVGVALGLATGYMLLKQTPRARNQLKRVARSAWSFEDAERLERCWLMLADVYLQGGKPDLAGELLQRVLQHNQGCARAHERSGLVAEKEQAHREAAAHYERAWRFGGRADPAVGYKLAFNHMKAKRYADAIDVCQQVLKLHPDYPRIRKDVLDKSRNNLRT